MKNIARTTEGTTSALSKFGKIAQDVSSNMSSGFSGVATMLSKIGPIGVAVAGGIALIGTAVIGVFKGMGALTSKLDGIAKSAKSVDMSSSAYMSLQHACNRAGIEMEKVLSVITKIDYAIVKSHDGEKKYREAFYEIGLSWRELENLSPEKRLMAINDAVSRIKQSGGSIPKGIYDVVGVKNIQTLNKMTAESGFNKFIAEAGALGYTIDEKTIMDAEAYSDAMGDAGDKLFALVTRLDAVKSAMKKIKEYAEEFANNIGVNGFVDKEFEDRYTGIGNEAEKLIPTLSLEEKKKLYLKAKNISEDGYPLTNVDYSNQNLHHVQKYNNYNREIENLKNMSENDFNKTFLEEFKNNSKLQTMLFYNVEKIDPRFKVSDKGTWVQENKVKDVDETIRKIKVAQGRRDDEIEDLNKSLNTSVDYYDKVKDRQGKLIDIEKEIVRIENDYKNAIGNVNAEIDKTVKTQLRMNAALANQKALMNEMDNLTEKNAVSYDNFIVNSLGNFGADKNAINDMFTSIKNVMPNDANKPKSMNRYLEDLVNFQWNKDFYYRGANESDESFYKRMYAEPKLIGENGYYNNLNDLIKNDPKTLIDALKTNAENIQNGNVFRGLNPQEIADIGRAEDMFNKYADMFKFNGLFLDKDSVNVDAQAKSYDALNEALNSINSGLLKDKVGSGSIDKLREAIVKAINVLQQSKIMSQTKTNMYDAENRNTIMNQMKLTKSIEDSKLEYDLMKAEIKAKIDPSNTNLSTLDFYKRQNILKSQGLNYSSKDVVDNKAFLDDARRYQDMKGRLSFSKSLFNQKQDLEIQMLRYNGNNKEAEIKQALNNAFNIKGSPLSKNEADLIRRASAISYDINNANEFQKKDNIIYTNELASKGGFGKSVAVDKKDNTSQMLKIQKEISKKMDEYNRVQNQISQALKI